MKNLNFQLFKILIFSYKNQEIKPIQISVAVAVRIRPEIDILVNGSISVPVTLPDYRLSIK